MTDIDPDLINGIDADAESLITLKKAAKLPMLRVDGKNPHFGSIYRWTLQGCRGVKLETIRVGGTTCTSVEAVRRFLERLSNPAPRADDPTPSTRVRQIRAAEATLAAAGI